MYLALMQDEERRERLHSCARSHIVLIRILSIYVEG